MAGYLAGYTPLCGVCAADGSRASYTFGDPNLAGNYLVTSLFVLAACRRPTSAPLRHLAYAMILVAIAFTGSSSARSSWSPWPATAPGGCWPDCSRCS